MDSRTQKRWPIKKTKKKSWYKVIELKIYTSLKKNYDKKESKLGYMKQKNSVIQKTFKYYSQLIKLFNGFKNKMRKC